MIIARPAAALARIQTHTLTRAHSRTHPMRIRFCGGTGESGDVGSTQKISLWNSWRLRVVAPFREHYTNLPQQDIVKSPIKFQLQAATPGPWASQRYYLILSFYSRLSLIDTGELSVIVYRKPSEIKRGRPIQPELLFHQSWFSI